MAEFIGANAEPYHVELFGSLPNEISIRRPDLVSRDAVAAGLRHYASQEEIAWWDMATTVDMLERGQFLSSAPPANPAPRGVR